MEMSASLDRLRLVLPGQGRRIAGHGLDVSVGGLSIMKIR